MIAEKQKQGNGKLYRTYGIYITQRLIKRIKLGDNFVTLMKEK